MNNEKYSKVCPTCNEVVFYKTKNSYWANKNKNVPCRKCKGKLHSKILKGRTRMPFTDKWKKNLAKSHKKSEVWKASMNTPEYKEKHRLKMIQLIKENKSTVAYNSKACDVFDYINKSLNWNGLHAKNEKEKVIDVFFLDYYEPTLNIAIEWDEKHHKKPSRYKADWIKQKVIMNNIKCEFYRVDETTLSVKKIDNNLPDHSEQIQNTIQKYYEINR
jgi:hypothetical protein